MRGATCSDRDALQILDRALEAGVTLVDTANVYSGGRTEELLGSWLVGKRARVTLATKCGLPLAAANEPHRLGRDAIVRACEDSLRRLRTDYIDLYQMHMQDAHTPIGETLAALTDLVTAGKVRELGCSNFAAYRLVEALWAAQQHRLRSFSTVQILWSLADRGAERELLPTARAFGLGVLVGAALGAGLLSGKYERATEPPAGSRLDIRRDALRELNQDSAWRAVSSVRAIAVRHEVAPAAVAIAWLLSKADTSSVIVGVRSEAQLAENLSALDVELTSDELAELDQVSAPAWGHPYSFIARHEPW
jgi:aryl-alcohol dehydrogenase-like predicted oxidoreductase